jgi:uncharacterized membrane protein YjfL (UPF0719 family)
MGSSIVATLANAAKVALSGALGLAVFALLLALMVRSAPTPLSQQISRERNEATAVLFAGFAIGVATVIAATLRSR